jgi:hypothetical protein
MAGDDGSSGGAGGGRGSTEDEVQIQIAGQSPARPPLFLLERALSLVIVVRCDDD